MLSKNVFKEGMEKLIVFYPKWTFSAQDEKSTKLWYEKFKKCDDAKFLSMIDSYVMNETYAPSVKALYNHYAQSNIPDAEETRKEIREKAKRLGW